MGGETEYVQSVINVIRGPIGAVAFIATALGAIIGGFFGVKLMKKHFSAGEKNTNA